MKSTKITWKGAVAGLALGLALALTPLAAAHADEPQPQLVLGGVLVRQFTTGGPVNQTFQVRVVCTIGGGDVMATLLDTTFTMTAQEGKHLDGLVPGVSCTATQTDPGAPWTTSTSANGAARMPGLSTRVTVVSGSEVTADFFNTAVGGLVIEKQVVGATTTAAFRAHVVCERTTPYGTVNALDETISLMDGGDKVYDLIAGDTCTVTESDADAAGYTTSFTLDGAPLTGTGRSASVTLGMGGSTTLVIVNTAPTNPTPDTTGTQTPTPGTNTGTGTGTGTGGSTGATGATTTLPTAVAGTSTTRTGGGPLARTGSEVVPLLAFAGLLIDGGALTLVARRRRHA